MSAPTNTPIHRPVESRALAAILGYSVWARNFRLVCPLALRRFGALHQRPPDQLITLLFSPFSSESQILVRAAFFRICADATLRGPDSTLVATYSAHTWRLGARKCREFHCNDLLCLRVIKAGGERESFGPYRFVRAAEGGLFVNGTCLGTYAHKWNEASTDLDWREITLLHGEPS